MRDYLEDMEPRHAGSRALDALLHGGLVISGWAACGATMYLGRTHLPLWAALLLHALAAPVFFGLAAWVYYRRPEARRRVLAFAAINTLGVIVLDVVVVALLVERSFAMFASVAGTWLPFALIFLASLGVGVSVRMRTARRAAPGPERLAIDSFLAQKRIAFVGLSTDPTAFSRAIAAELLAHGYELVPVHPTAEEILERPCYPRIVDIPDPPDAALVMTPAARSADVVRDCLAAGVHHVWLHHGVGEGSDSPEALALCDANGIEVIRGRCPLMFLRDATGGHRAHGRLLELAGSYPR